MAWIRQIARKIWAIFLQDMERTEKIESLKDLLKPAIENHGAFLVDVSLKGDQNHPLLEVFCETESGISIDKCAEISREILPLIVSSETIGDNFRLEVSSPGIGVPLKDKRQFKRNMGKLMSIKYREGLETKQIEGNMVDVTEERVMIETAKGPVEVGFGSIDEAIVKIRW
jgi:ribosome maturation factor RimP